MTSKFTDECKHAITFIWFIPNIYNHSYCKTKTFLRTNTVSKWCLYSTNASQQRCNWHVANIINLISIREYNLVLRGDITTELKNHGIKISYIRTIWKNMYSSIRDRFCAIKHMNILSYLIIINLVFRFTSKNRIP